MTVFRQKLTRHFNVDSNEKIDRFFYIIGKSFRTSVYMMNLYMTSRHKFIGDTFQEIIVKSI